MKKFTFYTFLCVIIVLQSCSKGHETDCFKGTGESILHIDYVPFFNKVKAEGRLSVHFIQDNKNEIEIQCGKNLLDGISYFIDDSCLFLDNTNKCNWVRRFNDIPIITVHYRELNYFRADNLFDNRFLSMHSGDSILIEYWEGNGRTWFYGDVNTAKFFIHGGSGCFTAKGKSNYTLLYSAGGSPNDLSEFVSKQAEVNTKSNNDTYICADSTLLALIFWTGNVIYNGTPQSITRYGDGSGQIIKK